MAPMIIQLDLGQLLDLNKKCLKWEECVSKIKLVKKCHSFLHNLIQKKVEKEEKKENELLN